MLIFCRVEIRTSIVVKNSNELIDFYIYCIIEIVNRLVAIMTIVDPEDLVVYVIRMKKHS